MLRRDVYLENIGSFALTSLTCAGPFSFLLLKLTASRLFCWFSWSRTTWRLEAIRVIGYAIALALAPSKVLFRLLITDSFCFEILRAFFSFSYESSEQKSESNDSSRFSATYFRSAFMKFAWRSSFARFCTLLNAHRQYMSARSVRSAHSRGWISSSFKLLL